MFTWGITLGLITSGLSVDVVGDDKMLREKTEWCNIWVANTDKTDKPRALLVGDSITQGYFGRVEKQVKGKMYCARLTTSASVADPSFLQQLDSVLKGYTYKVIHLNNGLHGFGYTEEEYQAGYQKAIELIKNRQPHATIICALTTPLKPGSSKDPLNPRVDIRNKYVREIAQKSGLLVNNLHKPMQAHPEYYRDPYHYKGKAIDIQARQVAAVLMGQLKKN